MERGMVQKRIKAWSCMFISHKRFYIFLNVERNGFTLENMYRSRKCSKKVNIQCYL